MITFAGILVVVAIVVFFFAKNLDFQYWFFWGFFIIIGVTIITYIFRRRH